MTNLTSKIQNLRQHNGFMKYFRNTSWLFGEKILRMVVGLFVGIWVARYLGPEQFGLFSYAQSFVGLFTAIATLGLDGIVVRELVKDKTRRDELIGTAFCLKLIGAIAVLVILAISINFTSNDTYTNTLVFIIASATIFQAFNVVDMYFQSQVMGKYITYANVISLLISSIIKIVLILYEAPLIAFAWTVFFDSFVLAVGFIYLYIKNSTLFVVKNLIFKAETAISLLRDSYPFIISALIGGIYMKIDQVMIMEMLNNEAVGQYAAAVRISELWYILPTVIMSSVFPALIQAKKTDNILYLYRFMKLYNILIWVSIIIALGVTFFSQNIVYLLYGSEYNQSSTVLTWHIWGALFAFIGIVNGKWFIIENKKKTLVVSTLIGTLLNIVLNYFLIPIMGINGAAISTVISLFFVDYFLLILFNDTKKLFFIISKSLFQFKDKRSE